MSEDDATFEEFPQGHAKVLRLSVPEQLSLAISVIALLSSVSVPLYLQTKSEDQQWFEERVAHTEALGDQVVSLSRAGDDVHDVRFQIAASCLDTERANDADEQLRRHQSNLLKQASELNAHLFKWTTRDPSRRRGFLGAPERRAIMLEQRLQIASAAYNLTHATIMVRRIQQWAEHQCRGASPAQLSTPLGSQGTPLRPPQGEQRQEGPGP